MTVSTELSADRPATTPARPAAPGEPTTLVELFLGAAKKFDKPDALNYKHDGKWHAIPSRDVIQRARNIGLGLYDLGLRRGDRIGLLSANCPEWTLTDAGCQFTGVIDVPIYTTQAQAQVAYILNDSGARVFFLQDLAAYERLREEIEACESIAHLVFFDPAGVEHERAMPLAKLEAAGERLAQAQPELIGELEAAVHATDLATIIYTSGTTGEPKGVMLTHSNLVTNVIDSAHHLEFAGTDITLSVLPLSHVFERVAMYMYFHYGMAVFYAESIDTIGVNLREVRPTIFIGVPRIFEKIYGRIKEKASSEGKLVSAIFNWAVETGKEYARHLSDKKPVGGWLKLKHKLATKLVFSKWHKGLGGRIRLFISGGAALRDDIGYIFLGAGLPIVQGYGLTETSPVITASTLADLKIGTVGKPIDHVDVRIAEDGEIEVHGPNVMAGYYNKPDATAQVMTEDGWFKTGDIGAVDDQGYLRITDRKKELFKTSGGKYIAPAHIEQMIKGSRFVNQVVLIGNGRKFAAALIVPAWEQIESYAKLKHLKSGSRAEMCRDPKIVDLFERQVAAHTPGLGQYETVKKVALLEHELTIDGGEMTPTLKIKRRVVDEKYRPIIDEMYEEGGDHN
jgi:long-chain acyl-CoA synthetase